MPTRCSIVIRSSKDEDRKDWKYIYHYFDGYPGGVGGDIRIQFTKKITNNSFVDNRYNKNDIYKFVKEIDEDSYIPNDSITSDSDYVYVITINDSLDGVKVECYQTKMHFKPDAQLFTIYNGYDKIYEDSFSSGNKPKKEEPSQLEELKEKTKHLSYFELLELMETITEELKNK